MLITKVAITLTGLGCVLGLIATHVGLETATGRTLQLFCWVVLGSGVFIAALMGIWLLLETLQRVRRNPSYREARRVFYAVLMWRGWVPGILGALTILTMDQRLWQGEIGLALVIASQWCSFAHNPHSFVERWKRASCAVAVGCWEFITDFYYAIFVDPFEPDEDDEEEIA